MQWFQKGYDLALWSVYRRTDRWRKVIFRRVTFLGWFMLIVSGVSAVFGTDVLNNGLMFIFLLGGTMLGIDFLSLFFRRNKVSASFLGISQGVTFVGQKAELPFQVSSQKSLGRARLSLYPWVEGTSFLTFFHAREPGEEKRNIVDRVLKFYRWMWLQEMRQLPFKAHRSDELSRSAVEMQRGFSHHVPLELLQRGKWSLVNLRLQLPGVFGFFERSCKTGGERGVFYIAPEILPVRLGSGGGIGNLDSLSLETSSEVGESSEFHSLRDYRAGDSWRKVNWKAMARTDKAMIQETETPGVPSYAVVFETGNCNVVEFENGLKLAASLVMYFVDSGARGYLKIIHGASRVFSWESDKVDLFKVMAEIDRGELWDDETELDHTAPSKYYLIHPSNYEPVTKGRYVQSLLLKGELLNDEEFTDTILID